MGRLTEKAPGCFEYRLKDHKSEPGEFGTYDAYFDYSEAVKRLGEYEDTGLEPEDVRRLQKDWTSLIMTIEEMGGIGHICDIIKAEQDGRLVMLPCKVGDTVYQIDAERVYESEVKWIIFDCDDIAFDERAIGGSIFLTREEAEAALKGGEG